MVFDQSVGKTLRVVVVALFSSVLIINFLTVIRCGLYQFPILIRIPEVFFTLADTDGLLMIVVSDVDAGVADRIIVEILRVDGNTHGRLVFHV